MMNLQTVLVSSTSHLIGPATCPSLLSLPIENVIVCINYYRIVASTSPSRIEAHAGLFRSLMKGIFDPNVL